MMSLRYTLFFIMLLFFSIKANAESIEYRLPFLAQEYPNGIVVTRCPNESTHIGKEVGAWDFAIPAYGNVVAVAAGKVKLIYSQSEQKQGPAPTCDQPLDDANKGNRVVISHADGKESLYLHLSAVLVVPGQTISQGQVIGKSGNTGRVCSSFGGDGTHLHFQLQNSCSSWYCQSMSVPFEEVKICSSINKVYSRNKSLNSCSDYSDVDQSNRYCQSISYAKERKWMEGYGNGIFGAGKYINRAEFLKIVMLSRYTLTQLEASNTFKTSYSPYCFSDNEEGKWYLPYVCRAKELGIVKGYGATNNFTPGNPINYVEALKIALLLHKDQFEIAVAASEIGVNWYDGYINLATAKGIPQLEKPGDLVKRDFAAHLLCKVDQVYGSKNARCSE